jgi:xylulokinase
VPATRILAFDVGTSGVKAALLEGRRIVASAVGGYGLLTGNDGWVEQDLGEIRRAMVRAARAVVRERNVERTAIDAIAITAQMFNLVAVDESGDPILPMLSWLDSRSSGRAAALAEEVSPSDQFRLLGSVVTAKDLLPKILWLRDERPELYRRTRWLLDCKEALVLQLTGRAVIDPAGSSAFRLVDPASGEWSPVACRRMGVDAALLPEVRPAASIAGGLTETAARALGIAAGTPVIVGAGDVPASQLGAGAIAPGDVHLSLGTAVYLGITLAAALRDPAEHLGVLGHAIPDRWILWLEIATGGGALAWLLRAMDGRRRGGVDYAEIDRIVEACAPELDGLLFAPWLSGERVPVFDDRLRGAFVGLGLHHGRAHLLRAVMEGVACQIRWAREYAEAYGQAVDEIRAVGGGAIGGVWLQIIADILGTNLLAVAEPQDAGARGVGALGLVAIGAEHDVGFLRDEVGIARVLHPAGDRRAAADETYARYRALYEALRPLYHLGTNTVQAAANLTTPTNR